MTVSLQRACVTKTAVREEHKPDRDVREIAIFSAALTYPDGTDKVESSRDTER